ncbi:hypothetical protein KCU73_g7732, partial [Aureobasidium melanogenum]
MAAACTTELHSCKTAMTDMSSRKYVSLTTKISEFARIDMDGEHLWIRSIVRDGDGPFEPSIKNQNGDDNRMDLKSREGSVESRDMLKEHGSIFDIFVIVSVTFYVVVIFVWGDSRCT